ncbi:hypothetical protein [Spongiactinospora gelatinilytica]|uniref:hypothetical protein n=1 Tax=Spongiactinospora gelatinilytica TaxID=2666298 RepID=UPI001F3A73CD|nr:hypothetical protein [Spongiactinospora gelatinilytica]
MTIELPRHDARRASDSVPWRAVGVFVALAFCGAWAAMLPLLLNGFRRTEAAHDMTPLT